MENLFLTDGYCSLLHIHIAQLKKISSDYIVSSWKHFKRQDKMGGWDAATFNIYIVVILEFLVNWVRTLSSASTSAHLLFGSDWARLFFFMLLWEGCYIPSLSWYPFVHLGREEQVRVKSFAQGHSMLVHTGFQLTTLGSWVRSSTAEFMSASEYPWILIHNWPDNEKTIHGQTYFYYFLHWLKINSSVNPAGNLGHSKIWEMASL